MQLSQPVMRLQEWGCRYLIMVLAAPEGMQSPWILKPSKPCSIMSYVRSLWMSLVYVLNYDDVMTYKWFLHYRPYVRGIHQSPVDAPHKGSVMTSEFPSFSVVGMYKHFERWWSSNNYYYLKQCWLYTELLPRWNWMVSHNLLTE